MTRVAILSYQNVALFELGCAVELFGLPRPEFDSWYDCDVISFTEGPLSSTSNLQLIGKCVSNLDDYDLLVVPSWPVDKLEVPEPMASALKAFFEADKRIISFCSGAFLLATLGFLKNRKGITHWRYANVFKSRFPEVEYIEDTLYFYDGKVGCSAGSSAGIDLGIELIRSDFGNDIANTVARRMVVSAHRKGSQSQFSESPVQEPSSQFSVAIDWAVKNLHTKIDMGMFAEKAAMSRRTFDRKFKANLNITPKEWLTHQRLNLAKSLLEKNTYGIEKVAELAGFENAITMRHHFRKELGVSPSFYREQFK